MFALLARFPAYVFLGVFFGIFSKAWAADPLKLPVTRDVWISAYPGEQEGNNGASPRLKFKGIQEFSLLDFDAVALSEKRVTRAELWLHLESKDAPLGRMTVSTVACPWEEGTGTGYTRETGASFRWAAPGRPWNGPGSDVTSVICGEMNSIWGFGDAAPPDTNGWQVIPVDPRVIQACVDGRSHGVFVQDDVGSEYSRDGEKFTWKLFPNRMVASRDMNRTVAPYFLIWVETASKTTKTDAEPKHPAVHQAEKGTLSESHVARPQSGKSLLIDLLGVPLGQKLYVAKNEALAFFIDCQVGDAVELQAPGLASRLYELEKDVLTRLPQNKSTPRGRILGEIYVSHAAAAGTHQITIRIADRSLPVDLEVWDFTLPDHLSFVPEMNAYGLPVLPGEEVEWYRLAHEHRLNLNVLRYGWNGRVADGCAPAKNGSTWDWNAWDNRFGPLLDGTAFRDLPRSGVPVDAFYLPLNEHWPADVHQHFRGGYWIEDAFDDTYWQEFSAGAKAFAEHARDRGWDKTWLQFYLNNKVYFKEQRGTWSSVSAPWCFDEPVNTQDFWALRRYGQEFNRAARRVAPNAIVRFDISRPEWQRDLLDGVSGIEVVSGALRPYHDRIARRQAAYGAMVTMYGTTAPPSDFPVQPVAWCVDAWCLGADGVLPWQTIGTKESWANPDPLSLFYPARSPMDPVVSPSLRVKSYRQGQQLVEYLTCYAQVTGQTRESLATAVSELLNLRPDMKKKNADDAGTLEYSAEIANRLIDLRQRLGHFLSEKHPPAVGKRVHWRIKTEETVRKSIPLER
jgi:hypothetical protein